MKVACTGCQYCMPCPSGVNIPLCFEHYNNLTLADNPDGEKFMYAARLGGAVALGTPEFASLCVQCGQCAEKCPQHIDIPAYSNPLWKNLKDPISRRELPWQSRCSSKRKNGNYGNCRKDTMKIQKCACQKEDFAFSTEPG